MRARLYIDIDDILGTGYNQEGRVRGTGMVGKRVEVVQGQGGGQGMLCTVNNNASRVVGYPVMVDHSTKSGSKKNGRMGGGRKWTPPKKHTPGNRK